MKSRILMMAIACAFCFASVSVAQDDKPVSPSDKSADQIQKEVEKAKKAAQEKTDDSADAVKPVPEGTAVAQSDCGCTSGCAKPKCNTCRTRCRTRPTCRTGLVTRLRSRFSRCCN